MSMRKKPTSGFWLISGVALLWNMMGAGAYINQVLMTPEKIATLSEGQQALFNSTPSWVTACFAIAVWMGVLGCILLLFRKKAAHPVFILSLIGALGQNIYFFFMTNAMEVYGVLEAIVLPAMVVIIAVFLIWFSKSSAASGYLS